MSCKPKLPRSLNRSGNCWLKVYIAFFILVEMGLGVAAIVVGIAHMKVSSISYNWNNKECIYYEGSSWIWSRYGLKKVCSSVTDTVDNHFQMPITLGGVVFFSSGILQLATSDKPICGLAFSIIALLFVMQPTVTITVSAFNQYYVMALCIEFLLIPLASIVYYLQQYVLKKATSSPPEKTDVVV